MARGAPVNPAARAHQRVVYGLARMIVRTLTRRDAAGASGGQWLAAVSEGEETQRRLSATLRTLEPLGSSAIDGPSEACRSRVIDRSLVSAVNGLNLKSVRVTFGRVGPIGSSGPRAGCHFRAIESAS